jgi:tetratricopeptide (TPR) repeat protein
LSGSRGAAAGRPRQGSVPRTWSQFAAALLGLGLALGCVSAEVEAEGRSSRAALERQLRRADDAFNGRSFRQALDMYSALYMAALSGGYDDLAAEGAAQASTINALKDAEEESDRWMSFAERYAEGEGAGPRSRVMLARGIRQWKLGDSSAALGTFEALVRLSKETGLDVRAMQGASLGALVAEGEAQLDWNLKAIDICQGLEQPRWEGALWTNHGWLLEARGDFEDASRCFERARQLLAEGAASPMDLLQADWALGRALRLAGRPSEARALLEQADVRGRELYAANPTARQAEWLGRAWWELAELELAEGRDENALALLQSARRKLLEAGVADAAPLLLGRLDARLIELGPR